MRDFAVYSVSCAESLIELFARLQGLPPELRRAALEAECEGKPDLLNDLTGLLEAAERERAEAEQAKRRVLAPRIGQRAGVYRITRLIGAGGMGAVYAGEREDGEFDHMVAIKFVAPQLASFWGTERFREERQILARINHPAITRLLDGGTTAAGQPYLVMEYVEGENILEHANRCRLTFDQRIDLFLKIAEAIDYLHRKLIVHLDLKPANILITRDGQPKVLDFGTALLLSQTDKNIANPALSLRYAAPEQLRGEPASPACDEYSLGLLLFELLAGAPAFPIHDDLQSAVDRAYEGAKATAPSTVVSREASIAQQSRVSKLRRRLRRDFDAILARALHPSPESRYGSVAELMADIACARDHRPVLAHKQTAVYWSARFLRRNWLTVLTLAVVFVSLTAAGLYARVQQKRAEDAFHRAQQRMFFLSVPANNLEAASKLKSNLADFPNLSPVVRGDLYAVMSGVPTFENREPLRNLQRTIQLYRSANDLEESSIPLATMALWERWVYGDMDAGLRDWRSSADMLRKGALKDDPVSRFGALHALGIAGWATRIDPQRTREILAESVALAREHNDLLPRSSLANALAFSGLMARDDGNLDAARSQLTESLSIFRSSAPDQADIALFGLSFVYADLGLYSSAESFARERFGLMERAGSGDQGALANVLSQWGWLLFQAGEHEKGREEALKGWQLSKQRNPPKLMEGWLSAAAAAYVLNESGQPAEAERAAREAESKLSPDGDASDPRLIPVLGELGIAELHQNRITAARSHLQRSLRLSELTKRSQLPYTRRIFSYATVTGS